MNTLNKLLAISMLVALSSPVFSAVKMTNSSNARVELSDLSVESDLTLSAWVYIDDYDEYGCDVLTKYAVSDGGKSFLLRVGNSNIQFYTHDGGTQYAVLSSSTVTENEWHHLAVTLDSSEATSNDGVDFFVDGSIVADDSCSVCQVTPQNTTTKVNIGDWSDTSTSCKGKIEEVAMWSKILTSAQISTLHSSRRKRMALEIEPDSILFNLPLDDLAEGETGVGRTFVDVSKNQVNGTGVDSGTSMVGFTSSITTYP